MYSVVRFLYTEVILKTKDNSKSDLGICELISAKHKIQNRWFRCKNSKEKHIHLLLWRLIRNQIYQNCHKYLKLSCYSIIEQRVKPPLNSKQIVLKIYF